MPSQIALTFICLISIGLLSLQAWARTDTGESELCRQAAASAAEATGVPYDVLLAISVVETGREGQPWPWTVNIGGEGHWSDTAEDAAALVESALVSGLTNVDLGCFQLNLYWHSAGFQSIEDMLDPSQNAFYAAGFLAEKYMQTGDWSLAAAAYHSATPEHAELYQTRFDATWENLEDGHLNASEPPAAELNRFPLLIAGQVGSAGSLVPATAGGTRLIGEP
ncbi:MAG TPA: transglycosylase SLT domain-containing protein [Tabrizicola sp.]|nr:transglycosylase SLT domain-containing protein [Tabrizicola sp.]HMS94759.1 transglycosylase SLT domain-containing protein [Tabrizicola sp.]